MKKAFPLAIMAIALGLLLVATGALPGCGDSGPPKFDGPPILVIGVDGLEWNVMQPLLDEGRLPHIQSLIDRGTATWLGTMIPTWSPVVWTSIATGVEPEVHDIRFFSKPIEGNRDLYAGLPYTSNCRKVPAIWEIADWNDRDVLSVAWWVSWPAEQLKWGRIVASYAAQAQGKLLWKPGVWEDGLPDHAWPPYLAEEIAPALEAGRPDGPVYDQFRALFPKPPEEWGFESSLDALFSIAYRGDATHIRIMREQLEERVAALNMVYVGLPDVAGHFFWRYHEPRAYRYEVAQDRIDLFGDRVARAYEVADEWIGSLLEVMPANSRIMVLSDHGMHAWNFKDPEARQSGAHEDAPAGVLIMAGPGIPAAGIKPQRGGKDIATVYGVMPTLLDWLDLDVPPDMKGVVWRHLMGKEYRRKRPVKKRETSYGENYRPATEPRLPSEGVDKDFNDTFLNEMGYIETIADEDPQ